ncbi:MAG: hypothetical protein L0Z62_25835 [Gemmataceae bacterium]|nr:hypothetical protein [Gemmataceae bacterium]
MTIRTFQSGDEAAQVAIYNEAAKSLPKFKPATQPEVQRRTRDRDFDPAMRLFAIVHGRPVGYAVWNANGRVSYPWCLPGYEDQAEPLFARALDTMSRRGFRHPFAAYRKDWQPVTDFFLSHSFRQTREMVNFVMDVIEMPTIPGRPSSKVSQLERADVLAVFDLAPAALRVRTPEELERHLFHNPYFSPKSAFVLHSRTGEGVLAAGVLIQDPTYADPKQVDSHMPCFRLGAFGTEGMQTKRIRGLFSFVARADHNTSVLGLDLMGQAALRVQDDDDIDSLAAQVPSDVPHLLKFYERNFRRQGSFPVFERELPPSD